MECYNIPSLKPPQAVPAIKTGVTATKSIRWTNARPKSRLSAALVQAAMLLHIVVCAVLLSIVRLPVAPKLPGQQTVALLFNQPQPLSPEPLAPSAMPDPPVPAEIPRPPEMPVAPSSAPVPPPLPPAAETKSSDPRPPITRPPFAHKATSRAKPALKPHTVEIPTASQPHPSDLPTSQPTSRPPTTEAPIPSEWQRSLATWLAAHKTYPAEARRMGLEGSVVLRLTVERSGRVLEVVPVRSAGSPMLDAAAEAMVRNAALPPFTAGMSQDTITVTVQIRYALTN
jgi:protein TonB